ncbi:MAG: FtsX-like permease family protein [Gammaproteobacteria bacterium]|nr:FtsX-like permease family protein [Gammaproteobacteria bacterium]
MNDRNHQNTHYEQTYNSIIENETQSLSNAAYFSGVISSVIGLFGLTALTLNSVQRRRKEISIRKILGGEDLQIIFMLSKNLLLLVALSSVFATAVSAYVVKFVYSGFSSYPDISLSVFLVTTAIALIICALTSYVISKYTMEENSSMTLRTE